MANNEIIVNFATVTKSQTVTEMIRTAFSESRIMEMLHEKGIRPSMQRIAVLGYVANSLSHPTADDIFSGLEPRFPSLSRTTVYNSLRTLVEAGLLYELGTDALSRRYDFATEPAHCHFLCRICGCFIDMKMPEDVMAAAESGYKVEGVDLTFKGICPECAGKSD